MPDITVLIIDDEKDLGFLIKGIVEKVGGYEAVLACSGREGIKAALEKKPDLILLDFVMPDIRGDKVLEELRAQEATKFVPVVLMSGLEESAYFPEEDRHKWEPLAFVLRAPLEQRKALGWKKAPPDIVEKYGVVAFLGKPFSRQTVWDVLGCFGHRRVAGGEPKKGRRSHG